MTTNSRSALEAFRGLGRLGKVAAVVVGVAAAVLLWNVFKLGVAVVTRGPGDIVSQADVKKQAEQYAAAFDSYARQIDGRSLFYVPPAPSAVAAKPDTPAEDPDKPPPPPSTYGGPAVLAMINDEVWFQDGKRLAVGAPAKDDLEVVRLEAPWDAVVRWKGVEFTVSLFKRDSLVIKDALKPSEPAPAAPEMAPAEKSESSDKSKDNTDGGTTAEKQDGR